MTVIEFIRFAHIAVGAGGLAAFWVPVFARKGGVNHVRFGKIFKWSVYVSMSLAAIIVCYRIGTLLIAGERPWTSPNQFSFSIFLGYLALVTFMSVHHGIGVLTTKKNPQSLRSPLRLFVAWSGIAASLFLIGFALAFRPDALIVLLALSPIGLLGGYGTLQYLNDKRISRHAWLYAHLGNMLGAGIAFHTAFAVFGMNSVLDLHLTGALQVLPWILPSVIGIPAILIWQRRYMKKFGDTKVATP